MQDSLLTRDRYYTKSSSFVMALIFTILCGIVAMTIGYYITYFTTGHFESSTNLLLEHEKNYLEKFPDLEMQFDGENFAENQNIIYIPTDKIPQLSAQFTLTPKPNNFMAVQFRNPNTGAVAKFAGRFYMIRDKNYLIATNITQIDRDFYFMQIIGWISIFFVMLVVFISYIISVFVVSGTNNIARTAQNIMYTGDLSRRIKIHSRWDDLSNSAAVINELLERIQLLMQGIKRVSDNIAHDMRTPITLIRHKMEQLDSPKTAEIIQEIDDIIARFNGLLRISRMENEQKRENFAQIDADVLIKDVVELYEPLMQEKNIIFHVRGERAMIFGDKDLLFQAWTNILDNAVKFTPQNGEIWVEYYKTQDKFTAVITDSGGGVAPDECAKIFDRYYRSDYSRSIAGNGLGLSMVKAIIELHNGQVYAQNIDGGLKIITII